MCADSLVVMATCLPSPTPELQAMSVKAEDIVLRPPSFYEEHNIEVQMGKEVSMCVGERRFMF